MLDRLITGKSDPVNDDCVVGGLFLSLCTTDCFFYLSFFVRPNILILMLVLSLLFVIYFVDVVFVRRQFWCWCFIRCIHSFSYIYIYTIPNCNIPKALVQCWFNLIRLLIVLHTHTHTHLTLHFAVSLSLWLFFSLSFRTKLSQWLLLSSGELGL